jgi:hypothetical protein
MEARWVDAEIGKYFGRLAAVQGDGWTMKQI